MIKEEPIPYTTSNKRKTEGNWFDNGEGFILDTITVNTNRTDNAR